MNDIKHATCALLDYDVCPPCGYHDELQIKVDHCCQLAVLVNLDHPFRSVRVRLQQTKLLIDLLFKSTLVEVPFSVRAEELGHLLAKGRR